MDLMATNQNLDYASNYLRYSIIESETLFERKDAVDVGSAPADPHKIDSMPVKDFQITDYWFRLHQFCVYRL
jgi:hypothetical protein